MNSLERRFWAKVRKAPGDGCWEWTGAVNHRGYRRCVRPEHLFEGNVPPPVRRGAANGRARVVTFRGERRTITEWARCIGLSRSALARRIDAGWPLRKALAR